MYAFTRNYLDNFFKAIGDFVSDNEQAFIVVVLMVMFFFITSFILFKLSSTREKKFELTIRVIAATSVILIIYNVLITSQSNIEIEDNRNTFNTLTSIQRNWLSPQLDLFDAYPESYFLYQEMTPDVQYTEAMPETYDQVKREQLEVIYSIRVFQAIEDFLTIGKHDLTGQYVWINNFLMWLQSDILRKHWSELSFNFTMDTRALVDRLIVASDQLIQKRKENGVLYTSDYDQISLRFEVTYR